MHHLEELEGLAAVSCQKQIKRYVNAIYPCRRPCVYVYKVHTQQRQ